MQEERELFETQCHQKIKSLREMQDDIEKSTYSVQLDEEAEQDYIYWARKDLELLREGCQPEDHQILQLLEQKHELICELERRKTEFGDEYRKEARKKHEELENTINDEYASLQKL